MDGDGVEDVIGGETMKELCTQWFSVQCYCSLQTVRGASQSVSPGAVSRLYRVKVWGGEWSRDWRHAPVKIRMHRSACIRKAFLSTRKREGKGEKRDPEKPAFTSLSLVSVPPVFSLLSSNQCLLHNCM